jgi:Na+/H+ antiporter NhaD/arsenite permease-like protein
MEATVLSPDSSGLITALAVFILTFLLISLDRIPNAIAAMLGGFLLIVFRVLSEAEALAFIDFSTVGLLCGMMITVAVMRRTGLFEYAAIKSIKITGGDPWRILVVLSIVTAVLSAFLDNVTTVLIVVPLTFAVTDSIRINPTPILISEILFSNIGGAATLIGDPPNIMIAGATHLQFMDFLFNNVPVIIIVAIVTFSLLKMIFYRKLAATPVGRDIMEAFDESRVIQDRKFFILSLGVFALIILAFMTEHIHGISLAAVAIGGGFIMMLVTGQDPREILGEIEWPTLFFFIGLFVIIGGLEKTGLISTVSTKLVEVTRGELLPATQLVLWVSALSTTIVNSIPYTATMISVIHSMADSTPGNVDTLWWALSLGACLGGNGTLIGAAANIVVAGFSQKTDYPLKFMEFAKVGLPIMVVSIAIVSLYLYLRYFFF